MILRPEQIRLLRMCRPATPANFGGGSESDSSTATTSNVRNDATSIDKRNVVSDAAVGITGDNNTTDRSTVDDHSTFFSDSSNKSTNFADSSNRSTNFADSSSKSSVSLTSFSDTSDHSVRNTTTDFGSVNAALSGMGQMGSKALDVTGGSINGVISALKEMSDNNAKTVQGAFDLSKAASAGALSNSAAVMGFAGNTMAKTNDAFAQAKDGGESKLVMYALGVVALIGAAFALKS